MASHFVNAAEVVFIEVHKDGRLVQLEPGGRFFHVAVRFKNKWLHAHPHRGVDLVDDISPYGDRFYYLSNPNVPDPTVEEVAKWYGKPFDLGYRWDNPLATYCTRLIANFFGVQPKRMDFSADIWELHTSKPKGELGLSPDELYVELIARHFTPLAQCEELLEPQ